MFHIDKNMQINSRSFETMICSTLRRTQFKIRLSQDFTCSTWTKTQLAHNIYYLRLPRQWFKWKNIWEFSQKNEACQKFLRQSALDVMQFTLESALWSKTIMQSAFVSMQFAVKSALCIMHFHLKSALWLCIVMQSALWATKVQWKLHYDNKSAMQTALCIMHFWMQTALKPMRFALSLLQYWW